jgi:DNA-binding GntR family transcriptional regulator
MEIQFQDLSYEVYKRLKAMILSNELKPGEQIKQEHIAARLGISRMPLHKAFQMLENEMLVENLPRRGFFVTRIDNKQLVDAFECREALEGVAVRRATQVMTKEEMAYLKSLFKPFVGKAKIDERKYIDADQEFHNSILKFSRNEILRRFEVISNISYRTYRGGLIRTPEETLPEHLAIIDAIEKKDAELAEKLTREHSRKSEKCLVEKFAASQNEGTTNLQTPKV